jgi:UDP-N-acetylmuramoyl-tripeptide--D-alanyl-D-alanine ligase
MEFSLAEVCAALNAAASAPAADARIRGWSIDSRTLGEGDLFFAIKGENFDGHQFVLTALERGAIAAVVSEDVQAAGLPLLRVPDTLNALQKLACWARQQWGRKIVAVTGSAGKTTTKDIIAAVLGVKYPVGKTTGNFNNHIGLPLSLLRMPADAAVGVMEMGMNHAGEIRALAALAKPDIGVVTNVGYAHIEAFQSIEEIALAKRELIESLPADGVAVLNADDERVLAFRDVHSGKTLTYGLSPGADVQATNLEIGAGESTFHVDGVQFRTTLAGRHGIQNLLAGLAVARLFGIELRELAPVVAAFAPGKMRGQRSNLRGITVLNDSYNSNPEAARAMVDVLCVEPAQRRIAVLGEMLELGFWAERLHRELGKYVAGAGIDVLVGVRGMSQPMVEEAKKAGLSNHAAFFFDQPEEAGAFLRDFIRQGDTILFKGSRGTHVERALAVLENNQ